MTTASSAMPMAADHAPSVMEISDPARLPESPLVTVIMTTFEHAPYVGRAIEGVLSQSAGFPFELIVAEDCSSDATRAIALEMQRSRPDVIRVVTGPQNIGGPQNFRRAFWRAKGRYIAFCEGDDYWTDPSKLAQQVDVLEDDRGCGAVHTEFAHVVWLLGRWRVLKRFQEHYRGPIPSGNVFDRLVLGNFIQTCTLCVRADLVRSYLEHPLGGKRYPVGDWPLCLYVAANSQVRYLDQATAVYRRVPGSATNRGPLADIARARLCMAMIEDFCAEYGGTNQIVHASHALTYEYILLQAMTWGLAEDFQSSLSWLRSEEPSRFATRRWQLLALAVANPVSRPGLAAALRVRQKLQELTVYR